MGEALRRIAEWIVMIRPRARLA
ncbi:MAG TPA: hypothetical protein VLB04_08530 [Methanotrichaceae archaeon]|nr:hypothetical protein [Methanotrichaceae archaeon]